MAKGTPYLFRMQRATTALLFWLVPLNSYAFPTTYHYFVTTDPAQLSLDSQSHWDPEASSDFITYQRPLEWDAAWYRGDKVFDLSVGSISSKQFLTYQRLKLHQNLTDDLEFRFHWLEERDWEQDRSDMPLELKYNFNRRWGVSLFGTPSLYKSEDDIGGSLYYTDSKWEYRASMVWGDFQRNKRNLAADEWSEAPMGITASALHLSSQDPRDFINTEVHWEPRSQRTNGSTPLFDMSQESISISGIQVIENGRGLGGRILYDRAYHNDYASSIARTRKRSLNQVQYFFPMGPHTVRAGLNMFYRENRENNEQFVYREILPTLWMQMLPRSRGWGTRTFSVGYDATVFEEKHQSASDHNLEHRLNLKADLRFVRGGQLALLFTFDLDRFGSGETWEGGAGQFRLDF